MRGMRKLQPGEKLRKKQRIAFYLTYDDEFFFGQFSHMSDYPVANSIWAWWSQSDGTKVLNYARLSDVWVECSKPISKFSKWSRGVK